MRRGEEVRWISAIYVSSWGEAASAPHWGNESCYSAECMDHPTLSTVPSPTVLYRVALRLSFSQTQRRNCDCDCLAEVMHFLSQKRMRTVSAGVF